MTNRYNELSKAEQAQADAFINSIASGVNPKDVLINALKTAHLKLFLDWVALGYKANRCRSAQKLSEIAHQRDQVKIALEPVKAVLAAEGVIKREPVA